MGVVLIWGMAACPEGGWPEVPTERRPGSLHEEQLVEPQAQYDSRVKPV